MPVSLVVYLTCFNRILNYCYYTMSDNQWFVKLLFGVNK